MSDEPRVRATRRRKGRLGCVVVFGLMLFAAGEIAVREVRDPLELDVLTGRRAGSNPMSPYAVVDAFSAYSGRPGYERMGKTINAAGYISTPDLTLAKPEGTLRIAFLGGSSTAGTGFDLTDEQTWPWLVTEALRQRFPARPIEFLNASLGGYCSFESVGRLWSRVRFFEPDVVVVYHGWNEMYYWKARHMDQPTNWRVRDDGTWGFDNYLSRAPMLEPSWVDPFLGWSQLLVRVRLKLAKRIEGEAGPSDVLLAHDFDHRGVDVWRDHLRLLAAICDVIGAELFVGKQATLIVPGLSDALREKVRYDYHGFDHDAHVAAFAALYAAVDEVLPADHVIDLSVLNGRADLLEDQVHPNPAGAAAIATIVAEGLAERSRVLRGE